MEGGFTSQASPVVRTHRSCDTIAAARVLGEGLAGSVIQTDYGRVDIKIGRPRAPFANMPFAPENAVEVALASL